MPLVYERDDVRRRVVATEKGLFRSADVFDLLERQRVDGTWTYGLLFDTLGMTGHPTIEDVREFLTFESKTDSQLRPRGPLALLSTDVNLYATACMCAALGGTKRKVEVFRDRDEADTWLAAQTGRWPVAFHWDL
jgi:hypothetical protein